MAITNKSKTPTNDKDFWRTSPEIINDAIKLLSIRMFSIDVCCTNASIAIEQAYAYIDAKTDALAEHQDWVHQAIAKPDSESLLDVDSLPMFCNPPFSQKWQFFNKAVEQVNKYKIPVLMVLPYTPLTQEWRNHVSKANCIVYRPDGRYQYLLPDGSKPKGGSNFESCLILVLPYTTGCIEIDYKRGL